MELGALYQFVLIIVLVAILVGVGVLIIDKFSTTSGVTSAAQASLNSGRDALTTINTSWLSIIVLVGVMAVIIGLVIGSFVMKSRR